MGISRMHQHNSLNIELIKHFIFSNSLTIKDFCKRCGICVITYYKIINKKNFNMTALFKIAKLIGVPIYMLFR